MKLLESGKLTSGKALQADRTNLVFSRHPILAWLDCHTSAAARNLNSSNQEIEARTSSIRSAETETAVPSFWAQT